jgi:hypothetical protein
MAIVLPFPLTIQEMRVLQEFRRVAADSLSTDAIKAIKHPTGGGEAPALSLVSKGFLAADGSSGYSLTQKAKDFLAIEAVPMVEEAGGEAEAAAE